MAENEFDGETAEVQPTCFTFHHNLLRHQSKKPDFAREGRILIFERTVNPDLGGHPGNSQF
jgi:hypothetical protein